MLVSVHSPRPLVVAGDGCELAGSSETTVGRSAGPSQQHLAKDEVSIFLASTACTPIIMQAVCKDAQLLLLTLTVCMQDLETTYLLPQPASLSAEVGEMPLMCRLL